ncbi:DoxX family protein [uncultured Sphingomonas sp.]|uniref:DoxX family protein n=1 Tax=uncultured Sphingomonas sp. TaxID=158754 RepID=UPI0035CC82F2
MTAGTASRGLRALLAAPDPTSIRAEPIAYLGLRIWLALTLMTHGVPKLLHLPHSGAPDSYAALVQIIGGRMHLPLSGALAMLVTLVETVGAAALAVGMATRLAAVAVIVDLLVAAFGVHFPKWDWAEGGMEYPLLMAAVAAYLLVRGGGALSLDRRLFGSVWSPGPSSHL